MSKLLNIYIDRQRMNYQQREGFPLSLNFRLADAENPTTVNGAHSRRNVILAGDGETAEHLEEWVNAGRINPAAANRKPARIEVNGLPVFVGVAQLDTVDGGGAYYQRRADGHKVGFIGTNADWFQAMKSLPVKDLEIVPVHQLLPDTIEAYANNAPIADTFGYTVIRTSDWRNAGEVDYTEFTLFVFIRGLLTEAFRRLGYRFQSDFFDSDLGSRLILPLPWRPYDPAFLQSFSLKAMDYYNPTTLTSSYEVIVIGGDGSMIDPGDFYNDSTGVYTAPHYGYYWIEVNSSTLTYLYRAQINGVVQPAYTQGGFGGVRERVFLYAGDEVALVAATTAPGLAVNEAFLIITPDLKPFETGTSILLAAFANPEWMAAGVLSGVTHAFGLQWSTDIAAQTVVCEPKDAYVITTRDKDNPGGITERLNGFYHSVERDDLTPRIDLAKNSEAKALSNAQEQYVLAWQTDGEDANLEALDPEADLMLFDGKYTFPANRYAEGVKRVVNPFFSKTVHLLDASIKHDTSTIIPQIPLMQVEPYGTEQTERGDFAPRLLYFAGRREGLDGLIKLPGGWSYAYPASWMVNYSDPSGKDACLAFCNLVLPSATTVGLLQRFHLQHLKRLEVGKLFAEWIQWNELDILRLNFRRKILLNNNLFLLQAIDGYKPLENDSSETTLLYDAIPERDDLGKVYASATRGVLPQ